MYDSEAPQSISEFFTDQNVLITGGTGFIGAVLLEKLLRDCPGISKIYLLLRDRSGSNAEERLKSLFETQLFSRIGPDLRKKAIAVQGDVSKPGLGLSEEDKYELCQNVSVVFHGAATINFNAALKSAINTNLAGTKRLLDLCHEMPNIKALVYVSTAYCNSMLGTVMLEQVYPTKFQPEEVIEFVSRRTPEELKAEGSEMIKGHPNNYAFSKHLTEALVKKESKNIPVAIIRPTIVMSTLKEPFPGWIDNVHTGGFAFIAGTGKGVFRVSCAEHQSLADLVPCDHVVNLMIAAAWRAAVDKTSLPLQVYHYSSGELNPVTFGTYTDTVVDLVRRHPCKEVLWYPSSKCRSYPYRVLPAVVILQIIPAFLIMSMCRLLGISDDDLWNVEMKFWRGMMHVKYFTKRQWLFDMSNTLELAGKLNPDDGVKFNFDIKSVNWKPYLETNVLGVREHYHKEPSSNLEYARKRMKMYWYMHIAAHVFLFLMTFLLAQLSGIDVFTSALIAVCVLATFIWL